MLSKNYDFYIKFIILFFISIIVYIVVFNVEGFDLFIVLILSIIFVTYGLWGFIRYYFVRNWISLDAIIIKFKEEYKINKITVDYSERDYFPVVEYKYKQGGVDCISSRVCLNEKDMLFSEYDLRGNKNKNKPWELWGVGKTINIHVNPNKNCEAVVIKKMSRRTMYFNIRVIVLGMFLFVFWLYFY